MARGVAAPGVPPGDSSRWTHRTTPDSGAGSLIGADGHMSDMSQ